MNLKDLLGDSFKEGMTFSEIETALVSAGVKLADLSTGQYVDKNKYDTDTKKLRDSVNSKDAELRDKMTDEQKRQADDQAKDNLIAQLQEQVKNQQIENNKNKSIATLSESKTLLEVKDDDKDYNAFLDCLAKSESEDSNTIATYFNTMIKNAYEKGKNDSTKNNLGKMGKQKTDGQSKAVKEDGEFGKKLAQSVATGKNSFSYFGKYNK